MRLLSTATGYALAAGAWAINLALFPPFAAYSLTMARTKREFDAFLAEAELHARTLRRTP